MGLGKMMDFTLMFIVTITLLVILNFSPSAYADRYNNNLTTILSSPDVPLFSFLSLLQKGKVIDILQTQANALTGLTLFAPNNAAIYGDKVPWGTLSAAQLQSLLLFHALPQYFGDTSSDLNNLCQLSPVTTMAGGKYTLSITSVLGGFYVNDSGSSSALMVDSVYLTSYPTEVYQIDKVLMPEAIFATNIPPPSSTSASSTAPSALTTSTPASTTSTPHKRFQIGGEDFFFKANGDVWRLGRGCCAQAGSKAPGSLYLGRLNNYYATLTTVAWLEQFIVYEPSRIPDNVILANMTMNCSCGDGRCRGRTDFS